MAKEVISRCDKCGTSEDVQEITIIIGGDTKTVDLCPGDLGPVVEVFELGAAEQSKSKQRRGRSAHAVVPVEDLGIEP